MAKSKSRSRQALVEASQTAFGKLQEELREALADRDVLMEALFVFVAKGESDDVPSIEAVFSETRKWLSKPALKALTLLLSHPPKFREL